MRYTDLKSGDIILFKLNNNLFHAAIFAPSEHKTTDIIDVTTVKGCARRTLEGLFSDMSKGVMAGNLGCFFHNQLSMSVVRHKHLKGSDIADQAEYWRLTHVSYAIYDLLNLTEATWKEPQEIQDLDETYTFNVMEYYAIASRAKEALIDKPTPPAPWAIFLSIFIAPILNLPQNCISLIMSLIRYIQPETNQGTNCGSFVLSVLGTVALKDVSYPLFESSKARLGSLITVNPYEYHPRMIERALEDTNTFIQLGTLETHCLSSKAFNSVLFHQEEENDRKEMAQFRAKYA